MLDEDVISQMLYDVLKGVSGIPVPAQIAFQNRPFVPPTPDLSASSTWVKIDQEVITEILEAIEQVTGNGLTVFRVFVATGSGTSELYSLSKAIADAFQPGQWLRTIDGVPTDCPVQVWRTTRGTPFKDTDSDAWYSLPVNVNWRVHVPNPNIP